MKDILKGMFSLAGLLMFILGVLLSVQVHSLVSSASKKSAKA
jgi:hypothetical protein